MKFVELTEEEFQNFSENHPLTSFHQTVEWGKLKEKNGWKYYMVGVKENDNIIAASLLLEKKLFLKCNLVYAPRGFLIDYGNVDLLTFFTNNLKKMLKKRKTIFAKIDPYVIHLERDIDGNVVEGGIDNSSYTNNLINLGYKHTGYNKGLENLQPRWAVALSLKNKTVEEIFKNMEQKTRQLINKNERNGLKVREIGLDELDIFKKIMIHTSERRNFIDRPFEYYKNMLITMNDKSKIVICEINLKEFIEKMNNEVKDNNKEISIKQDAIKNGANININKTEKKIEELEKTNEKLLEKINIYEKKMEEDGEIVPLGGIIYMIHGKEVLSLFGGAYSKYMELLSPYTTNYEMIKYAVENGYEKYNFYGIDGHYNDKKSELYGLYDFKRGFGGVVEEYIGEFNLVLSKPLYLAYEAALKIYKGMKKR